MSLTTLADIVSEGAMKKLQMLHLGGDRISEVGVLTLASALCKQPSASEVLLPSLADLCLCSLLRKYR